MSPRRENSGSETGRASAARGALVDGFAPPGVGTQEPGRLFEVLFTLEPERWMRRMPGRETFAWPGREDLVVKRTAGGEARDWWYELLHEDAPRSPGRREFENLAALREDAIAVPRPLAWVEEQRAANHPALGGRRRRSAVVMERVTHRRTLRDALEEAEGGAERAELLAALGLATSRLHGAGWYHRDLYLQHFVLADDAGELVLLDVGRARRESAPRRRWFVKDLAALLHSAPTTVTRAERMRFLDTWLAERSPERDARRRWARAVLRKEARVAAHAPRHVDPYGNDGGGAER